MIIIKVFGGTGNQLFQYALYRNLQEHGKDAFLDFQWFETIDKNYYRPNRLVYLKDYIRVSTNAQNKKVSYCDRSFISKCMRKIQHRKRTHYVEKQGGTYETEIFNLEQAYLEGYWQNERYFLEIREKLLREIRFPHPNHIGFQYFCQIANKENAVSVHIRRGDYLKAPEIYGEICTIDYYRKAMNVIEKNIPNAEYLIFSDDIMWAKANFKGNHFYFVEDVGENEIYELELMRMCRGHVVANSSFSWWGAWLDEKENKVVVSPSKWNHCDKFNDTVCHDWIQIEK